MDVVRAMATPRARWGWIPGGDADPGTHSTAAFGIAIPLCLTAIVAPHLRLRGGVAAVTAGCVAALATSMWPAGYGIPAAMAAAALAGGLSMGRRS